MGITIQLSLTLLLVPSVYGQLHLVTGAPDEKHPSTFASALYRLEDDGRLKMIAELVPQKLGTEWIGISYEWRKLVLSIGWQNYSIIVIDFDKPEATKSCITPAIQGESVVESWLADTPSDGPSFEWIYGVRNGADNIDRVRGMILDPSLPCERSFAQFDAETARNVMRSGLAGPNDWSSALGVGIDPDAERPEDEKGAVTTFINKRIYLGYEIPAAFRKAISYQVSGLLISDSHAFMVGLYNRQGPYRYVLFRKSDKTWHAFPVASEKPPYVRGFGRYIAAIETRAKSERNPRSAGQEHWRKRPAKMGPAIGVWADELGQVLPGKLFLYDVDTERVFEITTNQGDSEILLVENNAVYYRVNDQLFSAPLTDQGIGQARLLATDEAITDAHWAFMRH